MRNSDSQGWLAKAVKRAQATGPSIPRLKPHNLRHITRDPFRRQRE
ncbi:hypothetical protein [Microbacterium aurum]|nr:hypothetical protein [Microbacterium aurum]MBM7827576.1 hypothetical protein [Microbacterium aurum]